MVLIRSPIEVLSSKNKGGNNHGKRISAFIRI